MTLNIKPEWKQEKKTLRHTWAGLVNIDQFRWMTRKDTLDQLHTAHEEIGAKHVRAVGMFDDALKVIGPDPAKTMSAGKHDPRVNWQVVDYVIQSLMDIGINPMFTTTFIPTYMASGTRTCFTTKSNVSLPKNFTEWSDFVKGSVEHMVYRFGKDVVRNWYFEVWNEPNLESFFDGTKGQFFDLWKCTFQAIKGVDPDFRIGGPSTARAEWIEDLITFGRKNDCVPDYIITHCYNNDSASKPLSPFDGPQDDKANKSPHFIKGVVRGVRKLLTEIGYTGEVHWNEWGRSWHPFDPIRETEAEAAFIIKTMAEVSQDADYFAYWNLSDIYDQCGYGAETFHGNYGMLNLQGLRKPSYHAHQLLCRLGTQTIPVTSEGSDTAGAVVTVDNGAIKVLVYNYLHDGEPEHDAAQVHVSLPEGFDTEYDTGSISMYRLSRNENNIFTYWKEMGSPAYLKSGQLDYLENKNSLIASAEKPVYSRTNNKLSFSMETPSAALIEIPKKT
jgi:xylan 1,4-beta-xylosidase